MTREEFRDKKSKDYRKYREDYGIKDPVYLDEIEDAYYQGMVDADPHWISVKDRKPKIKHSEDNFKYSDTVIVTNGKYRTSARWLYSIWGGWYGWYDDSDEELKGITHWMPMPEPPKEGSEE